LFGNIAGRLLGENALRCLKQYSVLCLGIGFGSVDECLKRPERILSALVHYEIMLMGSVHPQAGNRRSEAGREYNYLGNRQLNTLNRRH
jgi:hypothetical protein